MICSTLTRVKNSRLEERIRLELFSRSCEQFFFQRFHSSRSIRSFDWPLLDQNPDLNQRFTRTIFVGSFSIRFFPLLNKFKVQRTCGDGGRNKSNRFPMNNSAFVSSNGCLETLLLLLRLPLLAFIPSWQRSRQGGFTRVDRVVFVDIFVSPPGWIRKRACNIHGLCVRASVARLRKRFSQKNRVFRVASPSCWRLDLSNSIEIVPFGFPPSIHIRNTTIYICIAVIMIIESNVVSIFQQTFVLSVFQIVLFRVIRCDQYSIEILLWKFPYLSFFFFILQIVLKYIYIYIEWNLIFYFS